MRNNQRECDTCMILASNEQWSRDAWANTNEGSPSGRKTFKQWERDLEALRTHKRIAHPKTFRRLSEFDRMQMNNQRVKNAVQIATVESDR